MIKHTYHSLLFNVRPLAMQIQCKTLLIKYTSLFLRGVTRTDIKQLILKGRLPALYNLGKHFCLMADLQNTLAYLKGSGIR